MQRLIKHPKQQFIISRKLVGSLFKYDARKYGVIKTTPSNIKFNTAINRLCFPLSCGVSVLRMQFYICYLNEVITQKFLLQLYTKVYKELNELQFLKNDFCKSSKLYNPRMFSTTTSSKQSSKGPSESSEDPDKDSKRRTAFHVWLLKFAICFIVTLTTFRLMTLQPEEPMVSFTYK